MGHSAGTYQFVPSFPRDLTPELHRVDSGTDGASAQSAEFSTSATEPQAHQLLLADSSVVSPTDSDYGLATWQIGMAAKLGDLRGRAQNVTRQESWPQGAAAAQVEPLQVASQAPSVARSSAPTGRLRKMLFGLSFGRRSSNASSCAEEAPAEVADDRPDEAPSLVTTRFTDVAGALSFQLRLPATTTYGDMCQQVLERYMAEFGDVFFDFDPADFYFNYRGSRLQRDPDGPIKMSGFGGEEVLSTHQPVLSVSFSHSRIGERVDKFMLAMAQRRDRTQEG